MDLVLPFIGFINGDAKLLGFSLLESTQSKKTTTLFAIPRIYIYISDFRPSSGLAM